jgi:uncharacterized protein (DUF2164 family)
MKEIEFSPAEKTEIVGHIQHYFDTELDQEIGSLGAELLLDFFSKQIGSYYYNRGLYDAQALLVSKLDEITESIYTLEKSK